MIDVPWFPNGDPLLPSNVSIYHRFVGDYHQTYDLLLSDRSLPTGINQAIGRHGQWIGIPIFLTGTKTIIERYTPWDYPWVENYSSEQYQLYERLYPFEELEPTDYELLPNPWPYELPDIAVDYVITWLQLDTDDSWVKRYQIVRTGQENIFNPLGLIALGSIVCSDLTRELISLDAIFSDLSISLSVSVIDDLIPVESSITLVSSLSTRVERRERQASVVTNDDSPNCCALEINYSFGGWAETLEELLSVSGLIDGGLEGLQRRDEDCSGAFGGNLDGRDNIDDLGEEVANILRNPPSGAFWWWVEFESDILAKPEKIEFTEFVDTVTETVDETYLSINDEFFFLCLVYADNNYWNKQANREGFIGISPAFYFVGEPNPATYSDLVLAADFGPSPRTPNVYLDSIITEGTETFNQQLLVKEFCSQIRGDFPSSEINAFLGSKRTRTITGFSSVDPNGGDSETNLTRINDASGLLLLDGYWWDWSFSPIDSTPELEVEMPDSIRIKEVHQALEASRFGSSSSVKVLQRPDGTTQEIQNTLAAQIEYSQEVLAAFNFPGRFTSYRQVVKEGKSVEPETIVVNNLPELIYYLYSELALTVGPGATVDEVEGEDKPITYSSLQDQVDDVLSNQALQFGLSGSQSMELRRVLWQLTQVLIALGVPCEVDELEFPGVGVVPVPRVSPGARTIRQALDDLQVNLTPKV